MNRNIMQMYLSSHHSAGHQPSFAPGKIAVTPGGAYQPPRNRVTDTAATVHMLTYSARKNIVYFIDPYSVMKPPTSSPSPSARSNGSRLVSPIIVKMSPRNDGNSITTKH